eukprot:5793163-Amphidinium_carterae.3
MDRHDDNLGGGPRRRLSHKLDGRASYSNMCQTTHDEYGFFWDASLRHNVVCQELLERKDSSVLIRAHKCAAFTAAVLRYSHSTDVMFIVHADLRLVASFTIKAGTHRQ